MSFGWNELGVPILGYLLGSIPSAFWICRIFFRVDITKIGSGNPGMTNVWRTLGWKPALPVALLDAAKGFTAAALGDVLTGEPVWSVIGGVVAVIGHSYSFLARFKGGKSVLTAFGVFLFLSPIASLTSLGLWLATLAASRIVSLSSLVAAVALPVDVFLEARWKGLESFRSVFWTAVMISLFVIIRHKPNIARLLAGTEPRFRGKST
jgi:glycerol-3-phosphate acyltransferase PlsY